MDRPAEKFFRRAGLLYAEGIKSSITAGERPARGSLSIIRCSGKEFFGAKPKWRNGMYNWHVMMFKRLCMPDIITP
jgi:hypothetical protein